jgi:hypothetical protein
MNEPLAPPYPRSGREPTAAELAADDERMRQDLADRDLPPTWADAEDDD